MSIADGPRVLFEDARFVVIDKPAGLACHPGPRSVRSVEDWFGQLSRRRDGPWLAHRLDADTSGCLVIALRKAALIEAQAAFAAGRVRKVYWALVQGRPMDQSGVVDAALAKRAAPGGWRMVADPAGQAAATVWRVMGSAGGVSWLELCPRTGRTHQVRVHCAALGCPILGDPIYGDGGGGLQLLARSIRLPLVPEVFAEAAPGAVMAGAIGGMEQAVLF